MRAREVHLRCCARKTPVALYVVLGAVRKSPHRTCARSITPAFAAILDWQRSCSICSRRLNAACVTQRDVTQEGSKKMKTWIIGSSLALALAMPHGARAGDPNTTAEAAQSAPDNSGRNVRDRQEGVVTPMDQSSAPADLELTQKIRKAVVADDGLSMNAHNVKIIAANGVVTLRGPVNSQDERAKIEATAVNIAGASNVRDQLEVAAK
jgi:osmotically-inducible protein OsmY